jgi:hypothetical protein
MDSIYFRDPLGQLYELASYRFEPPPGRSHAEVLLEAHRLRVAAGDYNIMESHLADAIETMIQRDRVSLSKDRSPKNPYKKGVRKAKAGSPTADKKRTLGKKAYGDAKTARPKRKTTQSERKGR